jgi:hypothetical protein
MIDLIHETALDREQRDYVSVAKSSGEATVRPIMRVSSRTIVRPNPVPPYVRVVPASACVKGSSSCATRSGALPIPVSRISNLTLARESHELTRV